MNQRKTLRGQRYPLPDMYANPPSLIVQANFALLESQNSYGINRTWHGDLLVIGNKPIIFFTFTSFKKIYSTTGSVFLSSLY